MKLLKIQAGRSFGEAHLKEAFGVDLAVYVPYVSSIIYLAFIGLVIGLIINFIMFSDRIHMVRALDDIISIAAAARNLRQ